MPDGLRDALGLVLIALLAAGIGLWVLTHIDRN